MPHFVSCWLIHAVLWYCNNAEKPAETAKEKAAREAREKKEKAQELIRKREAEEAAQNLGVLQLCRLTCVNLCVTKASAVTFILQSW